MKRRDLVEGGSKEAARRGRPDSDGHFALYEMPAAKS